MLPAKSLSHWYSTRATGIPKSLISKTINFRFLRTLAEGCDCLGAVEVLAVVIMGVVTGRDFCCCCFFVVTLFVVAFVVVVVLVVGAAVTAIPLIKLSFVVTPRGRGSFTFDSRIFCSNLGFSLASSLGLLK